MKNNIFAILLLLLPIINIYTLDTTADKKSVEESEAVSKIESIKDTLLYGIEDEIKALVNTLNSSLTDEYMEMILNRYKDSMMQETKIALITYFSKCDKVNENILKTLLDDASSDATNKQIKTNIFSTLAKHGDKKEFEFLISKIDDQDKIIQMSVSSAISRIKKPVIAPLVLKRLEEAKAFEEKYMPADVINNLILSLGETKYKEAVPYLKSILSDNTSEKMSISYSMLALSKIGDISSIDDIKKRLSDDDYKVREYAAYSLSTFKDGNMTDIYKEMLRHNDKKIRCYACQGIVNNNITSLIDILIYKLNKDPDFDVKNEALKSLVLLGTTGIDSIKKNMDKKKYNYTYCFVISDAVSSSPTPDNVAYIIDIYKNADKKGKEIIAKNTVKSRSNSIDPMIKELLSSEDYLIRIGSINSILSIKDTTLIEDVRKISESDPVPLVKKNAKKIINILETTK